MHAATKTHPSDQFLESLAPYREIFFVAHNNPDPDAIAAGWALKCLVEDKLGQPCRLVAGGDIVRAENRHLVDLLHAPIELVDEIVPQPGAAAVLVDCGPQALNHLLCHGTLPLVAVVDHHQTGAQRKTWAFRDIRPKVAASATIAASYLRKQAIEPGPKLATALLYAVKTETCGGETDYTPLDREMVLWLTERADPSLLARIENAPLPRSYFNDLTLAMRCTVLYGNVGLCLLPSANSAEIIGEMADLLIRCEDIQMILCGAPVGKDYLVSVRTTHDNAAWVVKKTLEGIGSGGGHLRRAGGMIPRTTRNGNGWDPTTDLRDRWLAACGIELQRGKKLIAERVV